MLEINKMKKGNIFGLTFNTCTPTTLHVMQTILIGMVVILTHPFNNRFILINICLTYRLDKSCLISSSDLIDVPWQNEAGLDKTVQTLPVFILGLHLFRWVVWPPHRITYTPRVSRDSTCLCTSGHKAKRHNETASVDTIISILIPIANQLLIGCETLHSFRGLQRSL